MSNVENAIGNSINNYQKEIMNTTERLFNSKMETELINKKNGMERKRISIRKSWKKTNIHNIALWKNQHCSNNSQIRAKIN